MSNILIIEDDKLARQALSRAIEKVGHQVFQAEKGEKGLKLIKSENIDMVLCDIKLPGMDGLQILEKIKKEAPATIVIMMTAFGNVEKAVKAIRLGALDFLEKPLDLEIVRGIIESALEARGPGLDRTKILEDIKANNMFGAMIGTGPAMHDVFETIVKVAPSRATVLIQGETGTGKELVARALHQYSNRKGPFIATNLSSITETLFESELFGHVRGAHSTALNDRKGRLEEAHGGTFFLDEVGDIPEHLQIRLLRTLETRSFERLGENTPRKTEVRFIAATNVNLEEKIAKGKFRSDFYYRLKVISIRVPPLREHKEDIPYLTQYFIQHYCKENDKKTKAIAPEAMELLQSFDWPGNIRQLEREIEKAVVMVEGDTLYPKHFSPEVRQTEITGNTIYFQLPITMREVEKELIRHTLAITKGNKTKTAELLGIGTRTLYRKIDEYDR